MNDFHKAKKDLSPVELLNELEVSKKESADLFLKHIEKDAETNTLIELLVKSGYVKYLTKGENGYASEAIKLTKQGWKELSGFLWINMEKIRELATGLKKLGKIDLKGGRFYAVTWGKNSIVVVKDRETSKVAIVCAKTFNRLTEWFDKSELGYEGGASVTMSNKGEESVVFKLNF